MIKMIVINKKGRIALPKDWQARGEYTHCYFRSVGEDFFLIKPVIREGLAQDIHQAYKNFCKKNYLTQAQIDHQFGYFKETSFLISSEKKKKKIKLTIFQKDKNHIPTSKFYPLINKGQKICYTRLAQANLEVLPLLFARYLLKKLKFKASRGLLRRRKLKMRNFPYKVYRVRILKYYRVIYRFHKEKGENIIVILKIGHRSNVYKRLTLKEKEIWEKKVGD